MKTFLAWPELEGQPLAWANQIAYHWTRNIPKNTMVFVAKLYHTQKGNGAGVATPHMCGRWWQKGMCGRGLTLASGGGGGVDAIPPWVFLSCTPNRLEYHAEIFYSLWGVLCATFGEKNWSGQVRSRSYDVTKEQPSARFQRNHE